MNPLFVSLVELLFCYFLDLANYWMWKASQLWGKWSFCGNKLIKLTFLTPFFCGSMTSVISFQMRIETFASFLRKLPQETLFMCSLRSVCFFQFCCTPPPLRTWPLRTTKLWTHQGQQDRFRKWTGVIRRFCHVTCLQIVWFSRKSCARVRETA